ncbi:unnamed protein product [Trichobilharzia regenti]|nr:unnamed protein product [Trichobilharzia regenti]
MSSLLNETGKKSRFKIKYKKKKSTHQVPLVIVEQCDREIPNNNNNNNNSNSNNTICGNENENITTINNNYNNLSSNISTECTYLYDSPAHSRVCRSDRHSLNCLPDKTINLRNTLHKSKSYYGIKPSGVLNAFSVDNTQSRLDNALNTEGFDDYSHDNDGEDDDGDGGDNNKQLSRFQQQIHMSQPLNYTSLNAYITRTLCKSACNICPASIQRAKRIKANKIGNYKTACCSSSSSSTNNLLGNNNENISYTNAMPTNDHDDDGDGGDDADDNCMTSEHHQRLESIYYKLLNENISHSNRRKYSMGNNDTPIITSSSSCHCFTLKQEDIISVYKLSPMDSRTLSTNSSSSCSSFNSLGVLNSPPAASYMSDTNLNNSNNNNNNSNYHSKQDECRNTLSNPSLYLQLPKATSPFIPNNSTNNNFNYSNTLNTNFEVYKAGKFKSEKLSSPLLASLSSPSVTTAVTAPPPTTTTTTTTTAAVKNKLRIKSLGDIFKIPRLSFGSEAYPKKSRTYQNINKIDCEINTSEDNNSHNNNNNNNSPTHNSNQINLVKYDPNFLTVPCEASTLRRNSQVFRKHARYSTECVYAARLLEQRQKQQQQQKQLQHPQQQEHQRKQRAISVDMSQTLQNTSQWDSSKTGNIKCGYLKQLLNYSAYNKSRQVYNI